MIAASFFGKSCNNCLTRFSPCELSNNDIIISYWFINNLANTLSLSAKRSANCFFHRLMVLSSAPVILTATISLLAASIAASISAPMYLLYGHRKSGMITWVALQEVFVQITCNCGIFVIAESLDHAFRIFHWWKCVKLPHMLQYKAISFNSGTSNIYSCWLHPICAMIISWWGGFGVIKSLW